MSTELIGKLRTRRRELGLTQAELAVALGTTQSAIARLESERSASRLTTVEAYAQVLGLRLELVAADAGPLQATVTEITAALADSDADHAFRCLIELNDTLRAADPGTLGWWLHQEPVSTGSTRWDASLAALAERAARHRDLPVQPWMLDGSRSALPWWFPVEDIVGRPLPGLRPMLVASSPPEFAVRGVFVDPTSFESV